MASKKHMAKTKRAKTEPPQVLVQTLIPAKLAALMRREVRAEGITASAWLRRLVMAKLGPAFPRSAGQVGGVVGGSLGKGSAFCSSCGAQKKDSKRSMNDDS